MKKYLSSLLCLLLGLTVFTACGDDDNYLPGRTYSVVADGVFIVNEGSYYSQINGSLDYLNYNTETVNRGVFKSANARSLGGTPNNAVLANQELYVACTDENRVEVINDSTYKSVAQVSVTSPREVATDGDYVYVTSYTGKVTKIDAKTHQIAKTSNAVGSHLEGIVVLNGYIYVCNSTDAAKQYTDPDYYLSSVLRINKSTLAVEKEITVEKNPTELLTDGTYVYVLCAGNYSDVKACLERISKYNDGVTKITDATMMAYDDGNNLYYVNAPYGVTPTYGVYNVTAQTTASFSIEGPKFPYSIGADPVSGDIFIAALSPNPDYPTSASYTTDGALYRYSSAGALKKKYTIGVNPGTLVFKSHSQVIYK
jgi:YVTN family beta-propeller protein